MLLIRKWEYFDNSEGFGLIIFLDEIFRGMPNKGGACYGY